MKKLIIICLVSFHLTMSSQDLKTVYLNKDVTTHFLTDVYMDDIDLSTNYVAMNLTNKKILAVKPINDENLELGILSITGQDFFKQYRLKYTNSIDRADKSVKLLKRDADYFLHPEYEMSNIDMYRYAERIKREKPVLNIVTSKKNKAIIRLNNIYVKGQYFFIDYSIKNNTNIIYDIDDVVFSLEDKKMVKNTNVQRLLIEPVYTHNESKKFKKRYNNIVCFNKMTFPDDKVFIIELAEKQISGRTIKLEISYLDVLNADAL